MNSHDSMQTILSSEKFTKKAKAYLLDNKRSFILVAPVIVAIAVVVFKISLQPAIAEKDLKNIQQLYENWSRDSFLDHSLLTSLSKNLEKHSEVASGYEGKILQEWIARGADKEMPAVIENLFKNVSKEDFSFYRDFSSITYGIQKGSLEKALADSFALGEAILVNERDEKAGSSSIENYLFAYNLFRIAMLCQKLEKVDEELTALREFQRYAGWGVTTNEEQPTRQSVEKLANHFSENQVTLKDYVRYREQKLLQIVKAN